ncbi:MAG: isoaspartyl peptidase/L-asparaginase [Holophaga sp.]|nr:isoaspartyl peptidase/L-asparaginase [Holophaga sp.]
MRFFFRTVLLLIAGNLALQAQVKRPFALVIHGGAGAITKENTAPEKERAARAGLEKALQAGYAVLEKGGTSLDAVEASVRVLEDDPNFNAGVGAVLTAEGTAELDSAIMDGRTLGAGSVAGLRHIKNPVSLARHVMEKSPHVMLIGEGAEAFAKTQGLTFVDNATFITPARLEAWKRAKAKELPGNPKGTVGAVALDQAGNLAAATSTGGMMMKKWGRVGDAPIIGIGTYADNATCAVSCTGWGEFFIRTVVAHDIAAQMAYAGTPLTKAAIQTLDKVKALGGDGGLIALDAKGTITMPFNTSGMFRAFKKSDGTQGVSLFGND